jgi:AraC-like DNA-binding protein
MHHASKAPAAMPPTASGGIARLAVARAIAAGIDPEPLVQKAGLTFALLEDRDARIGARNQITLLNLVASAVGDDLLGFHLAEDFDLREIGLLYYVLASSATLGEALTRTSRYSGVSNECVKVHCRMASDLSVHMSYIGVPRHSDRHQMAFWATALLRVCRHLTEVPLRPVRVRLAHPRGALSDEQDAFFGCKITFGAERDEITFARGIAAFPFLSADHYLNELLTRYCEEILARRPARATPMRALVENAIAPVLPHGRAQMSNIAETFGMSRRTLARRLAEEGVSFTEILEDMRRDLALRYLEDPTLSISQIAWLLGFQEISAFTSAFKRWTGATPTQGRTRASAMAGAA